MVGVLFDLDGTLLNTLEDLLDATNYALARHGFPVRDLEQLRCSVGNGAANQIRTSLPAGAPEQEVQAVLQEYLPYYAAHCRDKTRPYDGIPAALEALAKKYPLAIVSNKPDQAVKALCRDFFPGIYALGEAAGRPRKPAPQMIWEAMAAIGADRAVYIGDSEVDIRTAENAALPCVSVVWGFRKEEELKAAGAVNLCARPEQLGKCIEAVLIGDLRKREEYGQ